jgi:drug/metabolite transporter (DMT)-like permease
VSSNRPPENHFLPVVTLLYAAAFWGVVWYPTRYLEVNGISGFWLTAIGYTAAILVALPFIRGYRGIGNHWPNYLVMMFAAGWANQAFLLAMIEGTVVRAMLLFYMSPVWTLILCHFILDEKIERRNYLLMAVAMAGAVLMLWDPELKNPWPRSTADWLALSSGAAFALSNVMIRKIQDQPVLLKTASTWLGCAIIGAGAILIRGEAVPDATLQTFGLVILLGIAGFMVATLCLQYGVTHMRAQKSAVLLLFELIAGGISAWLLAGEELGVPELIGGSMIIASGYFVATLGQKPIPEGHA